jgi:hypothetical protein
MPPFQLVERDATRMRILDRSPFRRIGENVETAVDGQSPTGSAVEQQRTGPDVIVVDPRRARQHRAERLDTVEWNLGTDNRPEPRRVQGEDQHHADGHSHQ